MTSRPILIMAGGTGGHVFPALAVAEALKRKSVDVVWMGTERGLESRVVPSAGIRLERISVSGLRGKGWLDWVVAPFKLTYALLQSLAVLLRLRPAAVLGMGGFVTGPGGVAAWLLRKPLIIHEQNAVAGLTNRLLARLAVKVLEAFPRSFPLNVQAVAIGNPVREEIKSLDPPQARFAARSGRVRILVLGGSQGALTLNRVVPAALAELGPELRPEVWHQAGSATVEVALEAYGKVGMEARVEPFINAMNEAYGWADLVICRAGALTVSELASAGLGSVLVPYPGSVDDHQRKNAEFLVREHAAIVIDDAALTPRTLAQALRPLLSDRKQLAAMAANARHAAAPGALDELTRACLCAAGVTA